jgi:hypothetical protein
MVLAMTEVAALVVQERIKTVDASFTWPHPTDKGYFVSASFVRFEDDKPYLVYCPKTIISGLSIDKEEIEKYFNHSMYYSSSSIKMGLSQELLGCHDEPKVYIIPLGITPLKEVKKEDVEKIFGIKVV